MKIINAGYEILTPISEGGIEELKHIERIARICYKSEDLITHDGESAKKIVKMLCSKHHFAMIEHAPSLSVKFIVDRGISHEMVRHRLASFAQESTRYCNYSKDKFGREITVIKPLFFGEDSEKFSLWIQSMNLAEEYYFELLDNGATPQEARSVLPNSTKTEITITANYREWHTILELRTAKAAHPQIREVMTPLLEELKQKMPIIFDDIKAEE